MVMAGTFPEDPEVVMHPSRGLEELAKHLLNAMGSLGVQEDHLRGDEAIRPLMSRGRMASLK